LIIIECPLLWRKQTFYFSRAIFCKIFSAKIVGVPGFLFIMEPNLTLKEQAQDAALYGLPYFREWWERLSPNERAEIGAETKDKLKCEAGCIDVFLQRVRASFPDSKVIDVRCKVDGEDEAISMPGEAPRSGSEQAGQRGRRRGEPPPMLPVINRKHWLQTRGL
jgi:hypothetical protein